ncbi:ABC transporter substrate-binding protein [archaeon]|nr:ABC transporter substrate-binding protein [archaeon]
MSHFTVVVVGSDIDEQMEPYAEQDFEEKYGVFNNTEDENLEEYQNKDVDIVVLVDGSLHNKYEEQFKRINAKTFSSDYIYPEGSVIRQGKFSELYSTFEEFMEGWHRTSQRDEKTGLYGYWHNPQSHFDWYSIGGRWTGYFKPKAGATGELGRPGLMTQSPANGWVDSIKVGDIDVEGMQEESVREANETYDKIEAILQGRTYPSWTVIREKHNEDIEAARAEYNDNEVVKDFNKAQFHIWGDFVETYGNSREEYVERQKNRTMVPFAVVKDGQWYQKGEMGWWGCSTDEMTQDEWNAKFWEMINSLSPETELTLLDCHI